MFSLTHTAIDTEALRASLRDFRAGALTTFEGRVRNHNEGQSVASLEYEAYSELALKEGSRIVNEAKRKFEVYDCVCVHRLGALQLGEIAVWVGVSAAHRDAAFAACRYIIDEVKYRVPIWKKEQYSEGASEWVNCAHHAGSPEQAVSDENEWLLDALELSSKELASFVLVDIREDDEARAKLLPGLLRTQVLHMPLSGIDRERVQIDSDKKYLFICDHGQDSHSLVARLRSRGFANVFALREGIESLRRKFIA